MKRLFATGLVLICGACSTSNPQAEAIPLVNERIAVAGCAALGQLQAQSAWGGLAMTGTGFNNALADLKHQAATLGATHVLMVNSSNTVGGTNMIGDAYRCTH
jgi:hypothetical protein